MHIQTRSRAEELSNKHFGVADAAHLAFAEATADVFISCDDKLLKKCLKMGMQHFAMSPVEFTTKEELA